MENVAQHHDDSEPTTLLPLHLCRQSSPHQHHHCMFTGQDSGGFDKSVQRQDPLINSTVLNTTETREIVLNFRRTKAEHPFCAQEKQCGKEAAGDLPRSSDRQECAEDHWLPPKPTERHLHLLLPQQN